MPIVKRKRPIPKPPRSFTDKDGYKTVDAPLHWPFGMRRPFVQHAAPLRVPKK